MKWKIKCSCLGMDIDSFAFHCKLPSKCYFSSIYMLHFKMLFFLVNNENKILIAIDRDQKTTEINILLQ